MPGSHIFLTKAIFPDKALVEQLEGINFTRGIVLLNLKLVSLEIHTIAYYRNTQQYTVVYHTVWVSYIGDYIF